MDLLIPIAGKSKRFPKMRPKWSLTLPSGLMMFEEVILNINSTKFEQVYVICVRQQLEQFTQINIIEEIVKKYNANLIILPNFTNSQSETISLALLSNPSIGKRGFVIKDCDNLFDFEIKSQSNFVAIEDLHNIGPTIANNKSYVKTDDFNQVLSIQEKKIISNQFCCGAYGFFDRFTFLDSYNECLQSTENEDEIYISHVIYRCLLNGINFSTLSVKNYVDLGTSANYFNYCSNTKIIFCDIDGVLLENGGRMSPNKWETDIIENNINYLIGMQKKKNLYIYLTTSRDEKAASFAKSKIEKAGLKITGMIHSLPYGKRYLINDYSSTNPFPTAIALNIKRNSKELSELI